MIGQLILQVWPVDPRPLANGCEQNGGGPRASAFPGFSFHTVLAEASCSFTPVHQVVAKWSSFKCDDVGWLFGVFESLFYCMMCLF